MAIHSETVRQGLLVFLIASLALGAAAFVGCQPTPPVSPTVHAVETMNADALAGAKQALETAVSNTSAAKDANHKAIEAYSEACSGGPVKVQDRVTLCLNETDALLSRVSDALLDVKTKGALAVTGWKSLEDDYKQQISEGAKREAAKDKTIADQKIELTSRAKWTWFGLVGLCIAVVMLGVVMLGITKDKWWTYVSAAGMAGGIAVEVFKKVDALPDWYWMTMVGTIVTGGIGTAVWQFILSHKTPAAGAAVPKVGSLILEKLGLAATTSK